MSASGPSAAGPVVALDGLSGSGKSTLAKLLAARMGWSYLDSGAWYRALTWWILELHLDPSDEDSILDALSSLDLQNRSDGTVLLNGRSLGKELRTPEIDASVAAVADHLRVREALTGRMRALMDDPRCMGHVVDGRDAGTIIFPNALLKVFVETPLEVRAHRRTQQMMDSGLETNFDEVFSALEQRDCRDQARGEFAPRQLQDSFVIQNQTDVEQAVGSLHERIRELIPE